MVEYDKLETENDIRVQIRIEHKLFSKYNVKQPLRAIPHLENIIRLYDMLKKKDMLKVDDKAGLMILKSQYHVLCKMLGMKPAI